MIPITSEPDSTRHPTSQGMSRTASLLGKASLALAALFLAALVVYGALVAWLHHSVSGQAVSITQAAGLPADVERSFRGLLSWLLAIAAMPALVRLVLESLHPFRSTFRILGRLVVLMALGVAMALLPHGLRALRGVDRHDLPVTMDLSDPVKAAWWAPDGTPVLFHSTEDDGKTRFWNRPGITPDTGLPSLPVTREIRKMWKRERETAEADHAAKDEASRKDTEQARWVAEHAHREQEARNAAIREEETRREREARESAARLALKESEARAEEARRRAEAEQARAAAENARAAKLAEEREQLRTELQASRERERKQVVAKAFSANHSSKSGSSATPSPWHTIHLRPGIYFTARGRAGARIEIRSDGQGAYHLPDGRPPVAFRSGSCSFRNPFPECRFVCGQPGPLEISYRWTSP